MLLPHRGANGCLIAFFFGVILMAAGYFGLRGLQKPRRSEAAYAGQSKVQEARPNAADAEKDIALLKESGLLTKLEPIDHEAQIDRRIWDRLPVDTKKGVTLSIGQYFAVVGRNSRATLVDNSSGQTLATNGAWSGVEIKE